MRKLMKQLKRVLKQREALEMTIDYVAKQDNELISDEEINFIVEKLTKLHGKINNDLQPLEELQKNIQKYQVREIQITDDDDFGPEYFYMEEDWTHENQYDLSEEDDNIENYKENYDNYVKTPEEEEIELHELESFARKVKEQNEYEIALSAEADADSENKEFTESDEHIEESFVNFDDKVNIAMMEEEEKRLMEERQLEMLGTE